MHVFAYSKEDYSIRSIIDDRQTQLPKILIFQKNAQEAKTVHPRRKSLDYRVLRYWDKSNSLVKANEENNYVNLDHLKWMEAKFH
jgi:hypothetical protein